MMIYVFPLYVVYIKIIVINKKLKSKKNYINVYIKEYISFVIIVINMEYMQKRSKKKLPKSSVCVSCYSVNRMSMKSNKKFIACI